MAWCINTVTDTLRICSTHCFSTAAMVTRTLLRVIVCSNWLSCSGLQTFEMRIVLACTFISRISWFIYHILCKNALVFEIIKHGMEEMCREWLKAKPKIRIWFWHFLADTDQGTVFVLSSSVTTPPRCSVLCTVQNRNLLIVDSCLGYRIATWRLNKNHKCDILVVKIRKTSRFSCFAVKIAADYRLKAN